MRIKFTVAVVLFLSAQAFAQTAKVTPSKIGFYPENVRYDKGQEPSFNDQPVLYNETSKTVSQGEGLKIKSDLDGLGIETSRFQQTIHGIPVEYGIINIHVKNGKVLGQNGTWVKNIPQDNALSSRQKVITEQVALDNALSFVGADSYK